MMSSLMSHVRNLGLCPQGDSNALDKQHDLGEGLDHTGPIASVVLCFQAGQFPSDQNNFSIDTLISSLSLAHILLPCLWHLILRVPTFSFNS